MHGPSAFHELLKEGPKTQLVWWESLLCQACAPHAWRRPASGSAFCESFRTLGRTRHRRSVWHVRGRSFSGPCETDGFRTPDKRKAKAAYEAESIMGSDDKAAFGADVFCVSGRLLS